MDADTLTLQTLDKAILDLQIQVDALKSLRAELESNMLQQKQTPNYNPIFEPIFNAFTRRY